MTSRSNGWFFNMIIVSGLRNWTNFFMRGPDSYRTHEYNLRNKMLIGGIIGMTKIRRVLFMNIGFSVLLLISVITLPSVSLASSDYYWCKLEAIVETSHEPETAEYWLERYKVEEILVNRSTGEVTHPGLGNIMFDTIELIHGGDSGNGFKVISRSNNGWQVHYMVVEQYSSAVAKKFLIVEGMTVWRGLCYG